MKAPTALIILAALLVGFAPAAPAQDQKATEKKAAKKKAAKADDRNAAQKAESATGSFLHRNKIWTRREGTKKE